jgi:peptidylprolyl isomerase
VIAASSIASMRFVATSLPMPVNRLSLLSSPFSPCLGYVGTGAEGPQQQPSVPLNTSICLVTTKTGGSKDVQRRTRCTSHVRMTVRCAAQSKGNRMLALTLKRREVIALVGIAAELSWLPCGVATGEGLPQTEPAKLCDVDCEKELENMPTTTTASGLQYKEIEVGKGPTPPVGFQVAAHYVAMVPSGKVFDSSLDKGVPYMFRVGASQVIKGLDEGILSMKVGGKRRLFIPGELAFPKGLGAAPGRPRVGASTPVIFDVQLLYIPGVSDFDE